MKENAVGVDCRSLKSSLKEPGADSSRRETGNNTCLEQGAALSAAK